MTEASQLDVDPMENSEFNKDIQILSELMSNALHEILLTEAGAPTATTESSSFSSRTVFVVKTGRIVTSVGCHICAEFLWIHNPCSHCTHKMSGKLP